MKTTSLTLLACLCLSSCTLMKSGDTLIVAVGGKGAAKSKDIAGTWDNEKSLSDAMLAGTTIGLGHIQAGVSKAKEVTTRTLDGNATSVLINDSNNAVEAAKIGADVTKSTTLNPNFIPK